jgi:hypothetical protein
MSACASACSRGDIPRYDRSAEDGTMCDAQHHADASVIGTIDLLDSGESLSGDSSVDREAGASLVAEHGGLLPHSQRGVR